METVFNPPRPIMIDPAVAEALREDLGRAGDITTALVVPADAKSKAYLAARKPGAIAGLVCAESAFRQIDPSVKFTLLAHDGDIVKAGAKLAEIEGPSRSLLSAERVALNFLGHLSGVATATHDLVAAVAGTKARIVCTRKTLPGLRMLEKYAVRCGGGFNHRFGLDDAVLIKDNHIAAAGGIAAVMSHAREKLGHMVKIELEVDTIAQMEEALSLETRPDIIMLDNMPPDTMKKAVAINAGRAVLEASGNVTVATVRAIAETGVDYISSGWITHSAPNLDLGLDFI